MLLGACQPPPPPGIALLSASVSPSVTEGGETRHGDLPVAARGGRSRLHRINELCGGLTLWSEPGKLLLEKGKTRDSAQLNIALLSLGRRGAFCLDPGKVPRG